MKKPFFLICLFSFLSLALFGNHEELRRKFSDILFDNQLEEFYDDYLCETKHETADTGLTGPCSRFFPVGPFPSPPLPPTPPPPPTPPAPPPPISPGLLPIVLVNTTGLPDSQVFISVTGQATFANKDQGSLSIAANGEGAYTPGAVGNNALTYSLDQLPAHGSNRAVYIPHVISGIFWISVNSPLVMPYNHAGDGTIGLSQPDILNTGDPNYNTIFDRTEFNYQAASPSFFINVTSVAYFSIPLYIELSTVDPGTESTAGLTYSREAALNFVATSFSSSHLPDPEYKEWQKLIQYRPNGEILRLIAPQKSMSIGGLFDFNYLDNYGKYGFSYIHDIWDRAASFYRNHPLKMQPPPESSSGEVYTGVIDDTTHEITWTSSPSGYTVVFPAPNSGSVPTKTTTFLIFGGEPMWTKDTSGRGDGQQLSKLFQEAVIAGVIPTEKTVSESLFAKIRASKPLPVYYEQNSNLNTTTGPWFDAYSKALHSLGSIYTYAFDEPLFPEVQVRYSPTPTPATYLSITINPLTGP